MELASGTGLPSLAAHRCSARVTCTDVSLLAHQLVLTAAAMQSGGEISTQIFDIFLDSPERLLELKPDIVVASDLLYEEDFAEALGRHLGAAAKSGAVVITTDPGRLDGRGQTVFLESFAKAMGSPTEVGFQKQHIPDGVLDRGLKAMKYGGQVDRSVGVFEFCRAVKNKGSGHVCRAKGALLTAVSLGLDVPRLAEELDGTGDCRRPRCFMGDPASTENEAALS